MIDNLVIDNVMIDNLVIDNLVIDNLLINNLMIDNLVIDNGKANWKVRVPLQLLTLLRSPMPMEEKRSTLDK